MELRQYWELLRKWLWLIILTTVVAGAASYIFSIQQTPIYQASTRLLVSQSVSNSASLQYADILAAERLSSTYAQMLTARPVVQSALEKAGYPDLDPRAVGISVQPVRDTQLIDLKVEHPNPQVAANIANALPLVFIEFNNAQQTARYQESKLSLQQQLEQLNKDVRNTEAAIEEISGEGADAEGRRTLLEDRLAQYRSSFGNVLAQLESIRLAEANATDTIIVVEPAVPPLRPVRPRVLMNTLLAAIVGAMIGLGAAFLIEYLDDTVKNPDDVGRVTGLSTLGVIARQKNEGAERGLVTVENPRSPVAEAYRTIRTSIQFSSIDKPIYSLVVTSAGPSEGKSTTAANLAVVMAQTGKKTVLIDADLRKPTQHKRFGLPNTVGLTGALLLEDEFEGIEYLLTPSGVDNLWVITSGQLPHNPSELLGSQKLHQFAERLLQDYDFLIFDSPPALAVTDPAVLGQAMDGVLLVVDSGNTREPALMQTMREMEKVQAHVIGVALNRFKARGDAGYYYYYYNRYYSHDEDEQSPGDTPGRKHPPASRPATGGLGQRIARSVRRS
ncbi:MAG TPA: polysaccharide biosynthesis tyrosine autokinase [Caldilineae bacterium]|nr:polysaccharide biosynthesis tyrosine autokinase [Caldilineae bacterium]